MKNIATVLLMWAVSATSMADPVTVLWETSSRDCDGRIAVPDAMEIYISSAPIVAADTDCPTVTTDVPPAGARRVNVDPADGRAVIDLTPGAQHFLRARWGRGGAWSNLSGEQSIILARSTMKAPVIISISP